MCIFNCFRRKKKNEIIQKQAEEVIIKKDIKDILSKDENLSIIEKKDNDNNNLQSIIESTKTEDDFDAEVDTSKDFQKVMARNAAMRMIQSDFDGKSKNSNKLEDKNLSKNQENDKKKNFENLFKKDK